MTERGPPTEPARSSAPASRRDRPGPCQRGEIAVRAPPHTAEDANEPVAATTAPSFPDPDARSTLDGVAAFLVVQNTSLRLGTTPDLRSTGVKRIPVRSEMTDPPHSKSNEKQDHRSTRKAVDFVHARIGHPANGPTWRSEFSLSSRVGWGCATRLPPWCHNIALRKTAQVLPAAVRRAALTRGTVPAKVPPHVATDRDGQERSRHQEPHSKKRLLSLRPERRRS